MERLLQSMYCEEYVVTNVYKKYGYESMDMKVWIKNLTKIILSNQATFFE